jgi:hypothetical protein
MRILISAIGLLVALSSCGGMPAPTPGPDAPNVPAVPITGPSHAAALIDVDGEAAQLRAALMREVPEVIVDHSEGERVWIARAKAAVDASAQTMAPGRGQRNAARISAATRAGVDVSHDPLGLLKRLDKPVQQDPVKTPIAKADAVLVMFVEGIHRRPPDSRSTT